MSKIELKTASEQQTEARAKFSRKPGTKSLYVTLSDENYAKLEQLAADDDREPSQYLSRWLKAAFTVNQVVEKSISEQQQMADVINMGKAN